MRERHPWAEIFPYPCNIVRLKTQPMTCFPGYRSSYLSYYPLPNTISSISSPQPCISYLLVMLGPQSVKMTRSLRKRLKPSSKLCSCPTKQIDHLGQNWGSPVIVTGTREVRHLGQRFKLIQEALLIQQVHNFRAVRMLFLLLLKFKRGTECRESSDFRITAFFQESVLFHNSCRHQTPRFLKKTESNPA